jgi:hypothetical protein
MCRRAAVIARRCADVGMHVTMINGGQPLPLLVQQLLTLSTRALVYHFLLQLCC